ncbi:hypothetical protein DEU56DRAFT_752870 [Suillus clintonianus]|uniref:uncharacterized protein n=1 Tax=Suillus clintonianus TaxID=1904413 RepID=UPI001B87A4E0|nr:uncharacterized protein DEU56DRAFT_752870 [Suillus clintonianus]KAG2149217.1 hypothetical protein DEU56DRAFT_752870 [Suillus clintonianus]
MASQFKPNSFPCFPSLLLIVLIVVLIVPGVPLLLIVPALGLGTYEPTNQHLLLIVLIVVFIVPGISLLIIPLAASLVPSPSLYPHPPSCRTATPTQPMPHTSGVGKVKGLSKSVISHEFRGCHHCSKIVMAGKQRQRMAQADSSRQDAIQANTAPEMLAEDRSAVENMMADFGMEVEVFAHTAPPGEEAFDLSHAGGEHEAFEGLWIA